MPRVPNNGAAREAAEVDWKVIAISLYMADLRTLDELVERLRAMGHTKASRSGLIRFAISQVDLEKVPRGVF